MKKNKTKQGLRINADTIRVLSRIELRAAEGGVDTPAPPATNGSSAPTCQTTRFACCVVIP